MATWGRLAVDWPQGCGGAPIASFDLPTDLPAVERVPHQDTVLPDQYGAADPSTLPQPQAKNWPAPSARWIGKGLFRVDVLVDGLWLGAVYPPFGTVAMTTLAPGPAGALDWTAEHTFTLKAWFERVPPWREFVYLDRLKAAPGAPVVNWYYPHDAYRKIAYLADYPGRVIDAYGDLIQPADVYGLFGDNVPEQHTPGGDGIPYWPPYTGTHLVGHIAEHAAEVIGYTSPAAVFRCKPTQVVPPAGGGGVDTSGVGPPPPPPPTTPPGPPPPTPLPLRLTPHPETASEILDDGVPLVSQTVTAAGPVRSLAEAGAPSPLQGPIGDPRLIHIEPVLRNFWTTWIVNNRRNHARLQQLVNGAAALQRRRRR